MTVFTRTPWRWRRAFVGIIAVTLLLALPHESRGASRHAAKAVRSTHQDQRSLSREFVVSPLVTSKVRGFVASKDDLKRSAVLGRVVVPLVLLLLVAAELFAAAGRPGARAIRAFAVPLIALFLVLALVRFRAYGA